MPGAATPTAAIQVAPVQGDGGRRTPAAMRAAEEGGAEGADEEAEARWARPPAERRALRPNTAENGASRSSSAALKAKALLQRRSTVSLESIRAANNSFSSTNFLHAAKMSGGALGRTITNKEIDLLSNFDKERAAEKAEQKYAKHIVAKLSLSVAVSLLLQVVQAEYDSRHTFELGKENSYFVPYVVVGILVTTFNLTNAYFLLRFYRAILQERIRRRYAAEHDTITTSGMLYAYLRSAFFIVAHVPTWIFVILERVTDTDIVRGRHHIRMFFLVCGYFLPQAKIALYFLIWKYTSSVITDKLRFLARLNKVDVGNIGFGMRVQLELYPFTVIIVSSLLNVCLAAHNVSLCERIATVDEVSGIYLINDFRNDFEAESYTYRKWLFHVFSNNFGGNDILHPKTSCGQAVVSVSLLIGVVFLSILVAVLTSKTQLKPHEDIIIKLARLDMLKLQMRHAGSVCLQRAWRAKAQKWGKQNLVYSFNNALWMLRSVRLAENEERRRLLPPSTSTLELIWQLLRNQSEFEERMREALSLDPLEEDKKKPARGGASTKRMSRVGDLSQDGSPRYPNPLTDAPGTHEEMCAHFASYLREDPRVPASVKAAVRSMGGVHALKVGAL